MTPLRPRKRLPARPTAAPATPLQVLAAALNPRGGALLAALPFTLQAQDARRPEPADVQPGLFTNDDGRE